jgi:nitroreductase
MSANRVVSNEALIAQLNWRYAVKKFDPSRKISEADWATLEKALALSPSSYGLEPWKIVHVKDAAIRAKLRPAAYGQSQVTDASHMLVFASRKGFNASDVQKLIDRVSVVRNIPVAALEDYKKMMLGMLSSLTPELADAWSARQTYIALGVFLTSAAVLGIDACPMEGFNPAQFDEILGLEKLGYTARAIATAGYRAADDGYGKLAKVRFTDSMITV